MDTASQGISGQPCRNTTAHRLSAGPQAAVCLPMHPDFPAQGNLMPPNVKNYKNYKERAHTRTRALRILFLRFLCKLYTGTRKSLILSGQPVYSWPSQLYTNCTPL